MLPGIGVEQVEGTKGEGDREVGRLRFCGGARVLPLTGEEGRESREGRRDLSCPAGDPTGGMVGGRLFSSPRGIGFGVFFFPFEGFLFLSSFPVFCSSSSGLESPTSRASQRHFSTSCSCMRLMQVDSSAMPRKERQSMNQLGCHTMTNMNSTSVCLTSHTKRQKQSSKKKHNPELYPG